MSYAIRTVLLWEIAYEFWEITLHKVGSSLVVKIRDRKNIQSWEEKADSVTANCCCRPPKFDQTRLRPLPSWSRHVMDSHRGPQKRFWNPSRRIYEWCYFNQFYLMRDWIRFMDSKRECIQTNRRLSRLRQMYPITSSCCSRRILPPIQRQEFLLVSTASSSEMDLSATPYHTEEQTKRRPLFESWLPVFVLPFQLDCV